MCYDWHVLMSLLEIDQRFSKCLIRQMHAWKGKWSYRATFKQHRSYFEKIDLYKNVALVENIGIRDAKPPV